jgi:siderophore synthetase component
VDTPGVPHALKVHFPFKVSRYTRKMRAEVIEQAVNVSRELEAGVDQLDDDFAFLREVIGIAHRSLEPETSRNENWGYLVREMPPYPRRDKEISFVPGFALYGKDYFNPVAPPFIFELIQDRDPVEFVLAQIMLPIIRHWVRCFLQFGYLLEPHGQNVILALGGDHAIRRIVHRDLSVGIDMRRRAAVGLSEEGFNQYNRVEPKAFHSITYDRFMGGHFFDRLVMVCQERYPQIAKADFTEACREEFARLFPDYKSYFPETVWYFSEERDEYNKPLFQDTGTPPEWRPS